MEMDRLQRIIEGQHLEIKITLCKYSYLVEEQRKILFKKRADILDGIGVFDWYRAHAPDHFKALSAALGEQAVRRLCAGLSLAHIDRAWSGHLAEIDEIRESIHLRVYGKQDPLFEYNKCAIELFDAMMQKIDRESIASFNKIVLTDGHADHCDEKGKAPSATWTYLVNDNPFEDSFSQLLLGNVGFSSWAGLLWPLTALYMVVKRMKGKKERGK